MRLILCLLLALAYTRHVGAFVGRFLFLAMCSIGLSNAQSSKSSFWEIERIAESSTPTLQLFRNNDPKDVVDTVSMSRIRLLRDVKRRIEKEASLTARLGLTDKGSPNANAFSTSGEKGNFVAINLAMFTLLGDDADALAAVVGHEYAHIALNHREVRVQREGARQGISNALGFVLGLAGVPMAGTLSRLGTTAISRTFSRDEERDADEKGIEYAARAGFSVEGGIRAWEKMSRSNTNVSIPFLSTHPTSDERIETMRRLALNYPQRSNQIIVSKRDDSENSKPCESGSTLGKCGAVKSLIVQSVLSPCSGSYDGNTWTNCVGTYTYPDGENYVGSWKDGMHHGKGIYYRADGTVLRSGIWRNGQFIGEPEVERQSAENASVPTESESDIRVLQRRVLTEPTDARAWQALGTQYRLIGENHKAEQAYVKAVRLDSSDVDSLETLGQLYAYRRDKDKVKEVWVSLARLDRNRAERFFSAYILP